MDNGRGDLKIICTVDASEAGQKKIIIQSSALAPRNICTGIFPGSHSFSSTRIWGNPELKYHGIAEQVL